MDLKTSATTTTPENISFNEIEVNETIRILGCRNDDWEKPNHPLFQIAYAALIFSYASPIGVKRVTVLHAMLTLSFLLYSSWAWVILCSADVFSWNFALLCINLCQTMISLYEAREVKLPGEYEELFISLFEPLRVPRHTFKKLVSSELVACLSMHAGEPYATQFITKTDKLSLLIQGSCKVLWNGRTLQRIQRHQFIDSPEFESTVFGKEKFEVSIVAQERSKYVTWRRDDLEYLFIKEPYLKSVLKGLLARDIANKLFQLSNQAIEYGVSVSKDFDIRLPRMSEFLSDNLEMRSYLLGNRFEQANKVPPHQFDKFNGSKPDDFLLIQKGSCTVLSWYPVGEGHWLPEGEVEISNEKNRKPSF